MLTVSKILTDEIQKVAADVSPKKDRRMDVEKDSKLQKAKPNIEEKSNEIKKEGIIDG